MESSQDSAKEVPQLSIREFLPLPHLIPRNKSRRREIRIIERGEKVPTPEERYLTELWWEQVDNFCWYNFHKELGFTESRYRNSLPRFFQQPKTYKERFDVPLIIETRIPLERQRELVGIILDPSDIDIHLGITDITPVPDKPYTIWAQRAKKSQERTLMEAVRQFTDDEVGSPLVLVEVISYFLNYPRLLRETPDVYAVGSRCGQDRIPRLVALIEEVSLSSIPHNDFFSGLVLSRGREINFRL